MNKWFYLNLALFAHLAWSATTAIAETTRVGEASFQWRNAAPGWNYQFPRDHGAHEDFRIEWWYYTGNLVAKNGRRFGYQLTFFRTGINPAASNPSAWTIRHLALAHFAISDLDNKRFYHFERLNRAALNLAGAKTSQLEVWNGDWKAVADEAGVHHLSAAASDHGRPAVINLALLPQQAPIIHGENGVSQKGETPGNASHYYSFSRLVTNGTLELGDEKLSVEGLSWMDHEFGTSFLESEQVGWDWFSLQLRDREIMLFQLRNRDQSVDKNSSGTIIFPDGRTQHLRTSDIRLIPGKTWRSPISGGQYPLEWELQINSLDAPIFVKAAFPEQELNTNNAQGISYWEGSIEIFQHDKLIGRGYLEMTGYGKQAMGALMHNTGR